MVQLHGFLQQAHGRCQGAAHGLALLCQVLVGGAGLETEAVVLIVGLLQQGQGLAVQQVGMGVDAQAISYGAYRCKRAKQGS
ncbi:hypothetical protein D3C72_1924850 [compost metagenome]